jgi:hypothetical protein
MRPIPAGRIHADIHALTLVIIVLALSTGKLAAEELLGLYVGGAIGQSRVEATASEVFGDILPMTHTGEIGNLASTGRRNTCP